MSLAALYQFLRKHRLLHFVFTGGSGALLNLGITALLSELVFGRESYFFAYLIGLLVNFIYNFVLHTLLTFRVRQGHARRLKAFLLYNVGMTVFQAALVKLLVRRFGVDFYLPVIALVILSFSAVTYCYYRFSLFRQV